MSLRAAETNAILTGLGQVCALSLKDGAKGIPFKARATVTYCDPEWTVLFVQDGPSGVFVQRPVPSADPSWRLIEPGQIIDFEGITSAGIAKCNIRETNSVIGGKGPMPIPLRLESSLSVADSNDVTWATVAGVITGVDAMGSRSKLVLTLGPGKTIKLYVLHGDPATANSLLRTMVEATGVFSFETVVDKDGKRVRANTSLLWLSDFSGIRKSQSPRVMSIGDLPSLKSSDLSDKPIKVRGNVVSQRSGEFLYVRDDSGTLRVNFEGTTLFGTGNPVEVIGYLSYQGGAWVMKGVMVDVPHSESAANSTTTQVLPTAADTNLARLTQVIQVRNLSAAEAARGYPVRVTGIMTYNDTNNMTQFIQDETCGIFVNVNSIKGAPLPPAGQVVEILGFSGPGDFAPVIVAEYARVQGEGAFPTPKAKTAQALLTGSEDSQWVAIKGVVRSQSATNSITVLAISAGDSVVEISVPDATNQPARNFIDAKVEVQGVCATFFNSERRLQGIRLFVPDWDQILMEEAAPEDAFALPLRPISELLQFHASGSDLHRSRVQGMVLLRQANGSFFLQDATGGILVQSPKTATLVKAGETVELAGFPSLLNNQPVLQGAMIKPVAGGKPLEPAKLSSEMPLKEGFNGTLVSMEGRVLNHSTSTASELLTLQFGPWITDAVLEKEQAEDQLSKILPGSVVKLQGVYAARLGDNHQVQSFQLLLRSPQDITVVSPPPRWTVKNLLWLLGGLAVMLLLILAWVSLLRKEVQQRTSELRTEIEEHKHTENLLKTEIVQRRQIEEALQWSEAQLDVILESTADGILAVDNKGKVIKANKRFTELWRIPQSIMATRDDHVLLNFVLKQLSDPDAFLKKVQSLYSTGAVETDTLAFKDGRIFERYTAPMMMAGAVIGRVWSFRDVTQRKRQEKELSDKNAELERFTYTVSHDLRSPLVTVNTFLSYLEQDLTRPDQERIRQDVAYMRTAANKMGQLLEELLNLARIGRKMNPPERITFKELAQEVVRLVAGRISKGGVEVQVADADVVLEGDRPRLMEIWQNLVENACKFMGNQPKPRVEIGVERQGSDVVFFVRDNGMGIDPRYQEKVFGLFEKLDPKREGTGMGLALVKRIVELYEGRIWVESSGLGQGTKFLFTLPGAVIIEPEQTP